MNKKWKGNQKKNVRSSPVLFEDEEMGTASSDEVRAKSCLTPQSKRLTDHSTPIGNKIAIDSPELNYHDSPIIEPLTQHPPSEVGWDYRQFMKDEEDGNIQIPMDTCTPKRSTNHLLSKKRNSNSPLLYKPVKKKLIDDQQKGMEEFLNELKKIESSAKQKKDNSDNNKKTDSSAESQLIIDMEIQSDDSDLKLQVSANTNESPGQVKNEVVPIKSHNALLDDSIEDMMVLCSQEVEAKEFGTKQNQIVPSLYIIGENSSEKSHNGSSESIFKNPAKENIQPSTSKEKVTNVSDISSKNSSKSSKSESFPDDSFDDIFVAIDDKKLSQNKEIVIDNKSNTFKTHNKPGTSNREDTIFKNSEFQKKFFQSKSTNHVEPKSAATNSHNSNYAKTVQNSKVFVQSKVVNEKASYGYLNKDYMQKDDTANNTRIFKAKSFSDSNFLHQKQTFDRSHSNINLNSMSCQQQPLQNSEGYSSASSFENKGWRRANSSSSIGYSQSSINMLTNSEESQSASRSAAEIERKRQEAIERRKKKMTNNAAQKRPTQQPKR